MSSRSPGRTDEQRDSPSCPICARGEPLDIVATLKSGWLTMSERAPMRGYACFVFRRHAVELYDLTDDEAVGFMRDLSRVASAVAEATDAAKLNYEIHGNTLPHLHVHVFPRYPGDRFSGRPIDPREVIEPVYEPGEFAAVKAGVIRRVAPGAA